MLELFSVIVLILSATIHEYMHGFAANWLGDPTAKNMGRLTLNPIKHLDLFGSILLPLALLLMGSHFLFGWAKPVPYNPNNLSDRKYGDAKVAVAGPLANLFMALVFSMVLRFLDPASLFSYLVSEIVIINLILMVFNLVPIPPLDGSKILAVFLPDKLRNKLLYMDTRLSMLLVFAFVFFGFSFISPVIYWLFALLTGINL
ncbi:MAG: site-2 protease family protein [Candidatus Falkowbacteria bacterium]